MVVVLKMKRTGPRPAPQQIQRMLLDPKVVPPGMQQLTGRVYMRIATCDEVDCQAFTNGWTDPVTQRWNPPGTMCGELHKVPNGMLTYHYKVGTTERMVLAEEFVNRLGEGIHALGRLLEDKSVMD